MRHKHREAGYPKLRDLLREHEVLFEVICWASAWLVFPAWLAISGAGAFDFLVYAIGAGLLLSLGSLASSSPSFNEPWGLAGYTIVSCLAILLAGGTVFGLVSAFQSG